MGDIAILDSSQDQAIWDFLGSCRQSSIYHTPAWRDVLTTTYGYAPLYLGYKDTDGITALLPLMLVRSWLTGKRLVSLPFSNVCGPIGQSAHCNLLIEQALRLHGERGCKALEVRTQANINPLDDDRFSSVSYFVTSIVKLDPDPARVWKSFKDRNVRTEVRQAVKKGIEVRRGASEEDLERFYILYAPSRQKHGVPPQPYGFFRNIWRHLAPQYLDLFLATHKDAYVGSLITLGFGSTLCAAYIGSDAAYRSYRVHQILFWKAMEMGCEKGFESFDFLRTPRDNQELRYFKQRWNVDEVDLNYLYYPEVRGTASTIEDSARYAIMTHILKRSPGFVGRFVGRVLYRHLG